MTSTSDASPLGKSSLDPQKTFDARPTLSTMLEKGMPLYLMAGIQGEIIDDLYFRAYNLYSAQAYKEALQLFRSMTFYCHLDKRGWLGAGGCSQMLKEYRYALNYYSYLTLLDTEDPIPLFHIFDCYMSLRDYPSATSSIEKVILLSSNKPEHAPLKKRAESLRDALTKNISENK
ncbi:MAG: SycD/LcrH family type III secretion system chaperone [Chthoniobacterales bacterium]